VEKIRQLAYTTHQRDLHDATSSLLTHLKSISKPTSALPVSQPWSPVDPSRGAGTIGVEHVDKEDEVFDEKKAMQAETADGIQDTETPAHEGPVHVSEKMQKSPEKKPKTLIVSQQQQLPTVIAGSSKSEDLPLDTIQHFWSVLKPACAKPMPVKIRE